MLGCWVEWGAWEAEMLQVSGRLPGRCGVGVAGKGDDGGGLTVESPIVLRLHYPLVFNPKALSTILLRHTS